MSIEQQMITAGTGAVSVFPKLYDTAVVSGGPGKDADSYSFVIDCAVKKVRIAVITMDSRPGDFGIAVFDRVSGATLVEETLPISDLTTVTLLKYMEAHFAK